MKATLRSVGLSAGIVAAVALALWQEALVMAQEENKPEIALICTLTDSELQERRAGVIARLRAAAQERRELENGWSVRYSEEHLADLVEFIRLERKCCAFFEFALRFEPESGPLWLSVTGPAGAKAIIGWELRTAPNGEK